MKKLLLALLGFISLSTPLAVTAQQFGDFTYSSDDSAITITCYTGPGSAVTIPDTITGLPVTSIGNNGFQYCSSLTSVHFQGNAPGVGSYPFDEDNATAYYLPGTTGWDSTFGGIPTALWRLRYPLVLHNSLGVRSNQFGFTVSWATNLSVVVEASTDLANPKWSALATNALSGGTFYFSDPQRANHPNRFYRVRSQ